MIIGIRREDKNQWEGRVPLVPSDIEEIQKDHGIKFTIQPSKIRAFSDNEFSNIGVDVNEDLSHCNMVIAVKEIPVDFFESDKKYMFFSHTIKGQQENIPILNKLIEKKSTLIDYEKIVDMNNRRIVFFGKFAGLAGMIDSFYGYGQKLKSEGISNPFEKIKYATEYKNLEEAKSLFQEVADDIKNDQLKYPMIIGITGYGNVSKGAQEIINWLPTEELTPQQLLSLSKSDLKTDRIYKVIFKEIDMVEAINGEFELQDYYQNPSNYRSIFTQYLDKLNILINAVYWDKRYPRILSCDYIKENYTDLKDLEIIGDISCDIDGGVECTKKSTSSGNAFFVYNPDTGEIADGLEGKGPAILAVDNLPGEIARDSSTFFSNILKQYIPALKNGNFVGDFADVKIPDELKKAVIIYEGERTPDFKYLEQYL